MPPPTKLVGRCPLLGHPIMQSEEGHILESCACAGRMDGLFAAAFGQPIKLTRGPDIIEGETKLPGPITVAANG